MLKIKKTILIKKLFIGVILFTCAANATSEIIKNELFVNKESNQNMLKSPYGSIDEVHSFSGQAVAKSGEKTTVLFNLEITEPRELYITLQYNFKSITTQKIIINQGGKLAIDVDVANDLTDGKYRLLTFLAPIGQTWRERLSSQLKWDFSIDSTFQPPVYSVNNIVLADEVRGNSTVSVTADFDISQTVDFHIQLLDSAADVQNQYVFTQVNSGTSVFAIDIPLLSEGEYLWQTFITPVDAEETDIIGGSSYQSVNVLAPIVHKDNIISLGGDAVVASGQVAKILVDLDVTKERELYITLIDRVNFKPHLTEKFVIKKATSQTLPLNIPENLVDGLYQWSAYIVPVGGKWPDRLNRATFNITLDNSFTPDVPQLIGDFDNDNDVDAYDIKRFLNIIREGGSIPIKYDFNGDGRVNQRDIISLKKHCTLSRCKIIDNPVLRIMKVADFDQDGDVDRYDRSALFSHIINQTADISFDLNRDKKVDRCDIVFIKNICRSGQCN